MIWILKRTGVLIEDPGFYKNMTAAQNLEYFRIQFGIPGKDVVAKILAEVGLSHTGRKKFKQFSLGMKQRLGIGLALLQTPEFLILDEPINGLDPAGSQINANHNNNIKLCLYIPHNPVAIIKKSN